VSRRVQRKVDADYEWKTGLGCFFMAATLIMVVRFSGFSCSMDNDGIRAEHKMEQWPENRRVEMKDDEETLHERIEKLRADLTKKAEVIEDLREQLDHIRYISRNGGDEEDGECFCDICKDVRLVGQREQHNMAQLSKTVGDEIIEGAVEQIIKAADLLDWTINVHSTKTGMVDGVMLGHPKYVDKALEAFDAAEKTDAQ
jgi:predicted RNase H-like nuclease (RuvC/YqgF family)